MSREYHWKLASSSVIGRQWQQKEIFVLWKLFCLTRHSHPHWHHYCYIINYPIVVFSGIIVRAASCNWGAYSRYSSYVYTGWWFLKFFVLSRILVYLGYWFALYICSTLSGFRSLQNTVCSLHAELEWIQEYATCCCSLCARYVNERFSSQ